MSLSLSNLLKRDVLKELYLDGRISAKEYLNRLKRVSIVSGFFLIIGLSMMDSFALPNILGDSYNSLGLHWSALIAAVLSFLFHLYAQKKARATIKQHE